MCPWKRKGVSERGMRSREQRFRTFATRPIRSMPGSTVRSYVCRGFDGRSNDERVTSGFGR